MTEPFTILPGDVDLAGEWSLTAADGNHSAVYPVPGDVHSALIAANIIPHPYHGKNELAVRWVADEVWHARRNFHLTKSEGGSYYLDIDYLDTVADVLINGTPVLRAENCFRRYRPDVTEALIDGENTIEIIFSSNTKEAKNRQTKQPFYIPYSKNCPIPDGNMLRKPACHFGWDWNLAITPFGVYGSIKICRMEAFRIEHVVVHQHHGTDGAVTLDVDVTLHGRGSADIEVAVAGEAKLRRVDHTFGEARQRFRFKIEDPKLWWPAGHGEQPLYDVTVTCDGQSVSRSVGLRKIELLTDKDEAGSRFAFRVNGREIFMKGANWIPADALPSQATPELTRKLLQSAKDAHMNMIRVWGGGYYEKDFFYAICDELGLLVWQDFMFACNLYPSTPEFLREVKAEVDYQVRRLQHHACLALWCGDNELIGALTWFKESRDNRDRYLVNYDRLNRTIEDAVKAADPGGLWWPSSPSPGILDFGDTWHDDSKGDMHFWSVWHEGRDFDHYREVKPRFCSEFGFQSFSSMNIAQGFVENEDDLNIASPVMEHHQRNAGGNARIAETMFRNFRFPMDFANFVYLSQVQHALAMRIAVESWRSLKPHCMGTLYWQLNDTWPVASWSGLDHGGTWKALHYAARRFYAPVLITVTADVVTGDYIVSGVNDHPDAQAIDVDVFACSPAGDLTRLKRVSATLEPDAAVRIAKIFQSEIPAGAMLWWSWQGRNGIRGRNHLATIPYKSITLPRTDIQLDVTVHEGSLDITVSSSVLALYVMLECSAKGLFSDNVFDLLPGETMRVQFKPEQPSELAAAQASLVVRDLYSSSH